MPGAPTASEVFVVPRKQWAAVSTQFDAISVPVQRLPDPPIVISMATTSGNSEGEYRSHLLPAWVSSARPRQNGDCLGRSSNEMSQSVSPERVPGVPGITTNGAGAAGPPLRAAGEPAGAPGIEITLGAPPGTWEGTTRNEPGVRTGAPTGGAAAPAPPAVGPAGVPPTR